MSKDGASVEIQLTMYTKFLGLVKNRVDLLNLFRVWKNTASFCAGNGTLKVLRLITVCRPMTWMSLLCVR